MVVRNRGRCGKSLACDSSVGPGQSSTEPQSGPMSLINPDIGTFYVGKSQRDAHLQCLEFLHNSSKRPRREHTYPAYLSCSHFPGTPETGFRSHSLPGCSFLASPSRNPAVLYFIARQSNKC